MSQAAREIRFPAIAVSQLDHVPGTIVLRRRWIPAIPLVVAP